MWVSALPWLVFPSPPIDFNLTIHVSVLTLAAVSVSLCSQWTAAGAAGHRGAPAVEHVMLV